jgi:acylphosphatase
MDETQNTRLHARVEGRVQGVGFRYFVQETAIALGVVGWVRNRWDRTVEVVAEGDRQSLEKLLSALQRGPRSSHVTQVKSIWQPGTSEYKNFKIRMTA